MRFTYPLVFMALPVAAWAEDIPLQSEVSAVTLYPQGATVVREVEFSTPAGRHDLILTDLPKGTPLAAVRVSVDGAVMGSVTARDDFVPPRDPDMSAAREAARAEVERLEAALRDGEADVRAIQLEVQAAKARVAFLERLGQGEAVAGMNTTDLRDLVGMIGDESLSAMRAAHEAERRAGEADRALKDLRKELEAARAALRALVPEKEARAMLAVAVSSEEATEGTVRVSYTIREAGWTPVYDLHLARESGDLRIERGAFVRQSTGENWSDVAMTLSTVRPSEQVAPSEVFPWLRRVFDPEKIRPKPLMRSEADAMVGMAAPQAEPMPVEAAQATFDGLAVTYDYPGNVSVATGADRVRLALGTLETQAQVEARAVPLHDPSAFLMARVENDMDELILPTGEAIFYLDGRFIGKQFLEMIPAGGEADLSFGPIDGLRLTRTVLGREEGQRGVITRSSDLTETVKIEVENLTGQAWPLRVLDRVPYSEQEELEVEWEATPQASEVDVDGKRGVLAWSFDIGAGETREIGLDYDLQWPEGKVLR
ncbi:DUF4139 domain-containing protein [Roseovarius sp. A21]|uniref:DUF4139 domain-containing protein n=1 Tax=Roseovarius bejariae TaxID=2576383 RepID=A0A844CJR5_9RHOB|nr:DUF4139 domain-containing protein [Roseovarius bejariae]MRU14912.1 DUF4139 domain-containing protein [Roseovarius bejariae]